MKIFVQFGGCLLVLLGAFPLLACPSWMTKQITQDLEPYHEHGIPCSKCMWEIFLEKKESCFLLKFIISGNQIWYNKADNIHELNDRSKKILEAIKATHFRHQLPDMTFLISIGDDLSIQGTDFPVMAMCKRRGTTAILFPDFEAFTSGFQVMPGIDLEKQDYSMSWKERLNCLIWRGAAVQAGMLDRPERLEISNRVKLCRLSERYPHLIDAGFTSQVTKWTKQWQKPWLPFSDVFAHRYQIWLDGSAAGFSQSGWRLFTGSTVIKPDSPFIQWYFGALVPWKHYIPVKNNLNDLVGTIEYLNKNELLAEEVAKNSHQFAKGNITLEQNYSYLAEMLRAYDDVIQATLFCPRCKMLSKKMNCEEIKPSLREQKRRAPRGYK